MTLCWASGLVIGESCMLAFGFGYQVSADKKESYDNFHTMALLKYYSACDMTAYMSSWNIQIHLWLKYYVMLRLIDRKRRGF